jgi:hypothetical protein
LRKELNKGVYTFLIIFRKEKPDVLFIEKSFISGDREDFFRTNESEEVESKESVVVDLNKRIVL